MNKTNIEYLTHTWNPLIMDCTPVSEGCANCWARKRAKMLSMNPRISDLERKAYAGLVGPRLIKDRLYDPFKLKKPSIIGTQFMGDLFLESILDHQINSIFLKMGNADWHTYLVLTKRPERMADFVSIGTGWRAKMPHVWLGITAENQQTFNDRWLIAQQIPASVLWISMEPMLEPIKFLWNARKPDWIVAGCESGPGRRPAKIEWFRDLKNQCVDAGVPFFLKQANGYINGRSTIVKMPFLDGEIWNQRPCR